ncbi:hypothetical protein D5272_05995 [bacterium D16-76]|nr:hypothetical protein [bacterium D16-76]
MAVFLDVFGLAVGLAIGGLHGLSAVGAAANLFLGPLHIFDFRELPALGAREATTVVGQFTAMACGLVFYQLLNKDLWLL